MKKRYLCAGIVLMMLLSLVMVPVEAANDHDRYSRVMCNKISSLSNLQGQYAIDVWDVTGDDLPELVYVTKTTGKNKYTGESQPASVVHVVQYLSGRPTEILAETVEFGPTVYDTIGEGLHIWTLYDAMVICYAYQSDDIAITQYTRYLYNGSKMYKKDMLVEFDDPYGVSGTPGGNQGGQHFYYGQNVMVDYTARPEITEAQFCSYLDDFMNGWGDSENPDLSILGTGGRITGYYGLDVDSAKGWILENEDIFNELAESVFCAFSDVSANAWYFNDVKKAVDTGLINGYEDGTYRPDRNMTYAEAVKLAAVMHKLAATGSSEFQSGSPWYQPYVDYAKRNGIISKDYDWNKAATRAGYMEIFANAIPDRPANGEIKALTAMNTVADGAIPDVSMNHPQAAAIYKLYRAGILQGSDDQHNCKPGTNIRRSEVAAILTRMMNAGERISFTIDPPAIDPLVLYDSLLKKYRSVVNRVREWDPDEELGDPALYNIYTSYYPKAGYAFLDVNQDGTPELLLGPTSLISDWGDGFVYDLYTYRNGEIVKVFESAERDRYYLLDDGLFKREWSGGASNNGVNYYVMKKGETTLSAADNATGAAKRKIEYTSF